MSFLSHYTVIYFMHYIQVTEWLKLSFTLLSSSYSIHVLLCLLSCSWIPGFVLTWCIRTGTGLLMGFNLHHFPDSVHHTSTDPSVLPQLKEKEQMSGEKVYLGQDKPTESLKKYMGNCGLSKDQLPLCPNLLSGRI